MIKLPYNLCVQLVYLTKRDAWVVDEFLEVIKIEAEAREVSENL